MLFAVECVIICIIFTALDLIPLAKDPVGKIMSYPVAIRRRVETLPQYKNSISQVERKHIWIKVISGFIIAAVLAVITYFSGAKTFLDAFIYVFSMFMIMNVYDLLVMDIGVFMHCKIFWIPGTEDMVKEYHNPRHHIIGAGKGTLIGACVALLSASLVQVISDWL